MPNQERKRGQAVAFVSSALSEMNAQRQRALRLRRESMEARMKKSKATEIGSQMLNQAEQEEQEASDQEQTRSGTADMLMFDSINSGRAGGN